MVRKLALAFGGLGVASVVALYLLTILLLRRFPKPDRVSMNGITTIDDAVEACRRTKLEGSSLVAYARHLAASKFTYSQLNTWETPSRAFERAMGYCDQQAAALKKIYDRLGIASRPVFAARCKFPAGVIDGLPWPGGVAHRTWLRVKIGNEERDVCPGSVNNRPGVTHFEILSKARTYEPWIRWLMYVPSSITNIRRDMRARQGLTGAARRPIDAGSRRIHCIIKLYLPHRSSEETNRCWGRVTSLCPTCLIIDTGDEAEPQSRQEEMPHERAHDV